MSQSHVEPKPNDNKIKLRHAIAGALARCTEAIIMFPLDVVKTRLQFQGELHRTGLKRYKGIADALVSIGRDEGVKGFTRGLAPRLSYIVPAAAVSFLCYEEIVRMVRERKSILALTGADLRFAFLPVVGIVGARALGSLCRTPFDVVKMRLQVQGSLGSIKYKNTKQAIREIWRTEGPRGLFSYFHVALLRDMPFSIAYFSTYEVMKESIRRYNKHANHAERMTVAQTLLAGGVAGMVSTTITIPIDVVKTRLQTQALMPQEEARYRGAWHALREIGRTEGVRGLTKGLGARVLYLTPASAIMFASYEQYKKVMEYVI